MKQTDNYKQIYNDAFNSIKNMKPIDKYKAGYDMKISDMDVELIVYILKERWLHITLFTLLLLFIFLIGYYVGYNNAVVYMNEFITEHYSNNVVNNIGGANWSIKITP